MNFIETAFIALFFLFVGGLGGWSQAHDSVAVECETLGGFYVGNVVYKCVKSDQPLNESQELQHVDQH